MTNLKQLIAAMFSFIAATFTVAACVVGFFFFGTFLTVAGFVLAIVGTVSVVAYGIYEWMTGTDQHRFK